MQKEDIRKMVITTDSGKDVKDTAQLTGEASDSISGKNDTGKEYVNTPTPKGNLGGEAKH